MTGDKAPLNAGFVAKAKTLLEAHGFTVLRTKSYLQAQERQRVAEALRRSEAEHAESTRTWALKAFDSQREAWDRTTYLYGLAARLGATDEQLRGTVEAADSGGQENYDGPDASVECAYPPCGNRLRRSDFPGPQWCSKEHRSLTLEAAESGSYGEPE